MRKQEKFGISAKHYNIITLVGILCILILVSIFILIIDPYFHYHAPLLGHRYQINNERYQNNGIVKNFEYNAIITGTSMAENFRTSELNELLKINAVKVPYNGGTYKEINDNLLIALKNNPDVEVVIWGIDTNEALIKDKDALFHGIADWGYEYPWYMIDDNFCNDVNYLLNKTVFFNAVLSGLSFGECVSFDEAYFWGDRYAFSKEMVLSSYDRPESNQHISRVLTDSERETIRENIIQNIAETARSYPDTSFYLFIPPYSICWWDSISRSGMLNYYIEALLLETEELLQNENIKLFSFWSDYTMICNLDNYMDWVHYSDKINSQILQWIAELNEDYLLTEDNYQEYWSEIREFYSTYDYDSLFK